MPEQAETTQKPEKSKTSEHVKKFTPLVGLQARLLMAGNTLHVNYKHQKNVILDDLKHADQTKNLLSQRSESERKSYWEKQPQKTFEEKKAAWKQRLITTIQDNKEFSVTLKKLGIDTDTFNEASAEQIYDRYFEGESKQSNIHKFVTDVIETYRNNLDSLSNDLPAIAWFGNIFGENSTQIITQLIDAEVKLISQPQEFLNQINEKQRINNLLPEEMDLLTFLSQDTLQKTQITPEKRFEWKYRKLEDPRIFPEERIMDQITHPMVIAHNLQHRYPAKYGSFHINELARQIQEEEQTLYKNLEKLHLGKSELMKIVVDALDNYEKFITRTYGIKLPHIQSLTVYPIAGKTAENYSPGGNTFAFVDPRYPVIYLDMSVIAAYAKRMTADWTQLTPQQLGKLMTNLLYEINPHEYTHLVGDLGFWNLFIQEKDAGSIIGKGGLKVVKRPKITIDDEGKITTLKDVSERGRELMEAVTVELTNQWAKSMNDKLDLPAYLEERKVLHLLIDKLAHEQGISPQNMFQKFVNGYFTPNGFRALVRDFSGKTRPHFYAIVSSLMTYESTKHSTKNSITTYPLTKAYIQDTLSPEDKKELLSLVQKIKTGTYKESFFSPATLHQLEEKAG